MDERGTAPGYSRRRPEQTVLYRTVATQLEATLRSFDAADRDVPSTAVAISAKRQALRCLSLAALGGLTVPIQVR